MKKNTMATAIVAGLAGVAGIANISTAVNLNPDGVGQVLLYPYYTVNGGNATALSVVNTTDLGKAVKVRFLEAVNSREVLDFNLYLSAYDVWTAAVISLDAAGPGNITTRDTSCTVPGIESGIFQIPTLPGTTQRYFPFRTSFLNDGLGATNVRTRSGYIELLEMGSIANNTGSGRALTHGTNGRPSSCRTLEEAWLASGTTIGTGYWFADPTVHISAPTGGLFGAAAIVDVAGGTYINYNAEALDGWRSEQFHTGPGATQPSLINAFTAPGVATSYVFDRGRLITSNWATNANGGRDAVSAVLMRDAIFNEYEVDPDLGAASEWVVTFPTRRFYITANAGTRPFTSGWNGCERVSGRIYNREEDTFRIFDFSPGSVTTDLCREANVLWFTRSAAATGSVSPIHAAPGSLAVPTYLTLFGITQKTFNNGWFWLGFYDEDAIDSAGQPLPLERPSLVESAPGAGVADQFYGLPTIGYWAIKVLNVNQGAGLQASYGGAYPHRASRACFKGDFGTTPCD